jgi:hypothetical protein
MMEPGLGFLSSLPGHLFFIEGKVWASGEMAAPDPHLLVQKP